MNKSKFIHEFILVKFKVGHFSSNIFKQKIVFFSWSTYLQLHLSLLPTWFIFILSIKLVFNFIPMKMSGSSSPLWVHIEIPGQTNILYVYTYCVI